MYFGHLLLFSIYSHFSTNPSPCSIWVKVVVIQNSLEDTGRCWKLHIKSWGWRGSLVGQDSAHCTAEKLGCKSRRLWNMHNINDTRAVLSTLPFKVLIEEFITILGDCVLAVVHQTSLGCDPSFWLLWLYCLWTETILILLSHFCMDSTPPA